MSRKLWDFYNGEPFMENPHLVVIGANPNRKRSKKGSKKMAAKRKTHRRRRARRNPFPVAGLAINPRRRRRRARRSVTRSRRRVYAMPNRKRSHRRHRRSRSNPAILGVNLPPLAQIAWGTAGFLAPPMVEGFAMKFLPAEITTNTIGRYALKIASVLGLTFLAKKAVGLEQARAVALGGSTYVLVSAINEFVPQLTQFTTGTHAYRSGMIKGVGAYRTGMISTGVQGYARTNLARALPGLAQPSTMMPRFDLNISGMQNPVFADPRFTNAVQVSR